jgi:two-component system, NtrC family, sensor kinase
MQKSENEILRLIRYLPSAIIVIISIALTYYLYTKNIDKFHEETQKLEENYIELNKKQIKFQVDKIKERILYEKSLQKKDLENRLKTQVDNAYEIIKSIYEKNQDKTKEEILSIIKYVLEHIEFNKGRGYIFIYTLDGTNILHPKKKYLENTNLWNARDVKGTYYIQEMNKILKEKNETFYTWFWKKENDNKDYEKLGYFKKFEPLNIFIGAGEYLVDFEEELKERILVQVSNFRYDNDGYIFVIDYDGKYLGYFDSSYLGKTVFEKSYASNPRELFKSMLKTAKDKGGYVSYYNKKPNTGEKTYKYSYIDSIENWNWIIGTGFYMDDFYLDILNKKEKLGKENKEEVQKLIIFSVATTIVLLIIFFNLSALLEDQFKKYKIDLKKQINNNIKKDNLLAHQSKMAAMGEMIGNIAHQWRQPLSTISTIVTGIKMQKELDVVDEKFQNESLDMINKHVQYLSQTIDDFRNFFRTQKEPKEFLVESAFDKALGLVTAQFTSKNINIIKNIDDCVMYNLENELIQVLINILNNARDELLKIEDNRYIFVDTKVKKDKIFIYIRDNAGGISDEILPKIFEAYFTTKEGQEGTGIGLFMTEEMVIKHLNGNIFVSNDEFEYNSKTYKGAIFTLILPIQIN